MKNIEESKLGIRENANKLRWHLLPIEALNQILNVLEFGAKKYAPRNWEKGLSWSETYDSLLRHLTAWYMREENDAETGLYHLAHVGCNAIFLITMQVRKIGIDDRPKLRK